MRQSTFISIDVLGEVGSERAGEIIRKLSRLIPTYLGGLSFQKSNLYFLYSCICCKPSSTEKTAPHFGHFIFASLLTPHPNEKTAITNSARNIINTFFIAFTSLSPLIQHTLILATFLTLPFNNQEVCQEGAGIILSA